SIFEALPEEDLKELDQMAPMTHFNALPKGTLIQTPDTYRDGLFFINAVFVYIVALMEIMYNTSNNYFVGGF
ncbi:hypothetical protein P9317_17440, partial [Paenibacillus validus]|nr:hypothetical protein [Paenibacillus validus]